MQAIVVYVIVVLAALYAAWRLMPRTLRGRLGQSVATFGRPPARAPARAAMARGGGARGVVAISFVAERPHETQR